MLASRFKLLNTRLIIASFLPNRTENVQRCLVRRQQSHPKISYVHDIMVPSVRRESLVVGRLGYSSFSTFVGAPSLDVRPRGFCPDEDYGFSSPSITEIPHPLRAPAYPSVRQEEADPSRIGVVTHQPTERAHLHAYSRRRRGSTCTKKKGLDYHRDRQSPRPGSQDDPVIPARGAPTRGAQAIPA